MKNNTFSTRLFYASVACGMVAMLLCPDTGVISWIIPSVVGFTAGFWMSLLSELNQ